MIRETYYIALFSLLTKLKPASFTTVSRKLVLPQNMNAADFDALFMVAHDQPIVPARGQPSRHTLGAQLFIHVASPDASISADTILNGKIDAVENALNPLPGMPAQTLGGLVEHCWIEGTVEVFAGANSQIAAAIIPVKILVP